MKRRRFIDLFGKGVIAGTSIPPFLMGCSNFPNRVSQNGLNQAYLDSLKAVPFNGINPTDKDDLILADGLNYQLLISWGDKISKTDHFGFNNDFTCYIPLDEDNPDEGLLWVNHEYVNGYFINGTSYKEKKTKAQVDKEMYNVGGSIVHIEKKKGSWKVKTNSKYNRRLTGLSPIPMISDRPIAGSMTAIGTNSNCSGGLTPWGTILTCEENFDDYFGEVIYENGQVLSRTTGRYQWQNYHPYPSEHYGWVVEVDPKTGEAKKHVSLGRFSHECCTLLRLDDGRIVAYSGDDRRSEFIYKFVSDKPDSLDSGVLYVADTINGMWLALDYSKNETLREKFQDQTEVLVRCREAARLLGATPQNRPEDIEIDPITGEIYIALTNNKNVGDHHGSILKIDEKSDYTSQSFRVETFIVGGEETGITCPDNMAFDLAGNLWITSDVSTSKLNLAEGPYSNFKNNGLFIIPRHGGLAGKAIQIASAPVEAEITGPWFSPDFKTLFLSIQHPGEMSEKRGKLTSHWPSNDGISQPKPSVVCLSGPLLEKLVHLDKMLVKE